MLFSVQMSFVFIVFLKSFFFFFLSKITLNSEFVFSIGMLEENSIITQTVAVEIGYNNLLSHIPKANSICST